MKHILLLILITMSLGTLQAQHIVRGKVSDELGGILGATVVELDENERVLQGTITDMDGNYTIKVSSANVKIKFSFIGYKSVVEQVNGRNTVSITLESDAKLLSVVNIVGEKSSASLTGVDVRDQTGASTVVKMDAVQGSVVSSVGDALQGAVAGLDIVGGGSPGSGSSIVIRGLGTLGGSSPLIVVDGIIQKVSTSDVDFASADADDIGELLSIAPEDIKAVRVLKDAAETAVYGTQGANGVLEIETNKGSRGKTKFDISYKKSYSIEPPAIPMLNGDEYVMLQQEMLHNASGVVTLDDEISNNKDFIDFYNYNKNTDWVDDITQVGEIDDISFKVSGGGDKTNYYASVSYQNQTGTVKNTASSRFTTRINLDYNISTKLKLNTSISYVNIYKDDNWFYDDNDNWTYNSNNDYKVRSMAYLKAPNMAIYDHDSKGNKGDEFFTPITSYQGNGLKYFNPSAVVALSDNDQENNSFQTNFVLRYLINDWLTFKETVSFQFKNAKKSLFLPYSAIGTNWLDESNNLAKERNTSGTLVLSQSTLNISPLSTETHKLSGLLMLETRQNSDEYIQSATGSSPSTYIIDPAASPMRSGLTSGSTLINSVGVLGNIHYKLLDQHMFQFNVRGDASSRFGTSSRWGFFPSASYAWRFSSAKFLQNMTFLDDSKVRMSYGLSGNSNVGAYDRHGLYSSSGSGAYMDVQAIIPTQVELQKLKWETSTQLNIGLDLSMFNHRWTIQAEYFDKITDDVMWKNYKIPTSAGYTTLKRYNDGRIQNNGVEFTTSVTAIKSKDWTFRVGFNIYTVENKFLEFPENVVDEEVEISNGKYPVKAEVGKPVGSFFGFRYLGVYPTTADAVAHNADGSVKVDSYGDPIPMSYNGTYTFQGGDAKYEDVNHDGIINLDDVVYLGDSNPLFAGGFDFTLKYKRWQMRANFLYRYGNDIVNAVAMNAESMTNKNNQSKAVLNRWRVPGQDFEGILPRAYYNHTCNNLGSDRYVEDASYIRLNNLALDYSFSPQALKPLGLRMAKVGFQARKLLTLTNYTGQDPEVTMKNEDALWFGKDTGTVPPPIVMALTLKVGF